MESSGPLALVKNEENKRSAATREVARPAAKCHGLTGAALRGRPLASKARFQNWFKPSARATAARVMTNVSFVAAIRPAAAPARRIQPIFRVRQYRQPAPMARK